MLWNRNANIGCYGIHSNIELYGLPTHSAMEKWYRAHFLFFTFPYLKIWAIQYRMIWTLLFGGKFLNLFKKSRFFSHLQSCHLRTRIAISFYKQNTVRGRDVRRTIFTTVCRPTVSLSIYSAHRFHRI